MNNKFFKLYSIDGLYIRLDTAKRKVESRKQISGNYPTGKYGLEVKIINLQIKTYNIKHEVTNKNT